MLKKIALIPCIIFPFFCCAQKFYLQTGAGYQFSSSSAQQGYAIELNTGLQLHPHFRLGLGASYVEQNNNVNPAFVPVYANLKLMGSGRIKPYFFFNRDIAFISPKRFTILITTATNWDHDITEADFVPIRE